jgi:branched-chain amino acid transport system permease protein
MFLTSWWSNNETLIQIVIVYALVAFSIQVALKAGTFSLASIGFYSISSYAAADLVGHGWPTVLAIVGGVVISAVVGWVLARLLVRLKDLYLGMATVAFDLMVGVVALNWVSVTGGPTGKFSIPVTVSATGMLIVLIVVVVLLELLQRGTIGRTIEATREDTQLAVVTGIDTRRYQRFAFVLSAMLGGLAGGLHALSSSAISPDDANFSFIILALAMVIIGGFGSWIGALIGAIVLGYLPLRLTSIGDWWPVIYGSVMLLVATYLPGGIYALIRRAISGTRGTVRLWQQPDAPPSVIEASPEPLADKAATL